MYSNHRGMVPGVSPRVNELLDQVRVEFEAQQTTIREMEQQSEWFPSDSMVTPLGITQTCISPSLCPP